jgi:ATP-binding cassette subfamily B protein
MSQTFIQEDSVQKKVGLITLFKKLWPHFMRRKVLLFSTIVAVLGLATAGRAAIWLFGYAVDQGILKKDPVLILWVAFAYLGMEVLQIFCNFAHMYFFAKLGNGVLFEIRAQLIRHVQALPIPFFDKNPSGRITNRLTNDVVSLGEIFTQGIITVFSNALIIVVTIGAMFLISVKLTLAVLVVAPPIVALTFWLSEQNLKVLRESKKIMARLNAFVAENVSGMRVLQLYQGVDRNRQRFAQVTADYRDIQLQSVRLNAYLWPTMSIFNAVTTGVALYFGGIITRNDLLSTGALISFLIYVRNFIEPLRTILEKYQTLQESLTGAERIFTLLAEPEEINSGHSLPSARIKGQIEFRNLCFRYSPDLPWALNNISFFINSGQSVALVGRTGSGKSTTIALLQRFYDYESGEILLDGIPFKNILRSDLRKRIGVVQQDTFMFKGTIAANISLNDPSISLEQIERAASRACCDELLRRHKGGLNAVVEERGLNFSFGERQLIAFARVLAFDPDILILDEATANIDSQSEAAIQKATKEVTAGRTSLIIAHRISTILECDQILVLDHGEIKESGTHTELIKRWALSNS